MRNMMKYILLLLVLYAWQVPTFSQSGSTQILSDYVNKINQFNKLTPQEKVYLHFDNTGYFLGDIIWFKAYVVFAEHSLPTSLSKILHVELLTPQGEVIDSQKLEIKDGQCHGDFKLKKEYLSGFYEVRAYTHNMINFGDDCIFSRVFPVYKAPSVEGNYAEMRMDEHSDVRDQRQKRENTGSMNLSFYPEGGNAVMGIRSRIAFKATGAQGEDLNITGTVYDDKDLPVATLSTIHQGMGFFELTPETTRYKVVVESDSEKRTFPFVDIKPSGYTLRVEHLNDSIFQVKLQKSLTLPYDTVALSVSCRGTVYSVEAVGLGDDPYVFNVDKDKLPAGCLQFTLFDTSGNILSERLSFNNRSFEYLTVTAKSDKSEYKAFEKVNMELFVHDLRGNPVETTFSVAVRDADTEIHTAYQDNILTNLLLSSDVRGYIENPMQYFVKNDRSTRTKLDLLMMVQGWRRYNWQLMSGVLAFDAQYAVERTLGISGKVLGYLRNAGMPGVEVMYWMRRGKDMFHGKCKTNEKGEFNFSFPEGLRIIGKWDLGIQVANKDKRKHCRILLDRSRPVRKSYTFYDTAAKGLVADSNTSVPLDSLRKRRLDEIQLLPEVKVMRKKRGPSIVLNVENDMAEILDRGEDSKTISDYLEYRLKYFRKMIYATETGFEVEYNYKGRKVGISLNCKKREIQEKVTSKVKNIFGLDVASISDIYVYDDKSNVSIVAKLYDDEWYHKYIRGVRYTFYWGYARVGNFYHVDNSKKILGDVDYRRTLYWNPDMETNSDGKVQVDFYNNTTCRKMTVSAEGISINGIPVVIED